MRHPVDRPLVVTRPFLSAAMACVTLVLVVLSVEMAQVAPDVGFQGPSYFGASRPATADKPESKLWYAGGRWWAVMWDTAGAGFSIYGLDRRTETWIDTGTSVDTRSGTLADTLFSMGKLYVASHVATADSAGPAAPDAPAHFLRYSFDGTRWSLDAGFPTTITNYSSESMSIDMDSRGDVWATWTQVVGGPTGSSAVYVARGADGGASWGTPFVVPASDEGNRPHPDDISAVVAFDGDKIGILWSNQITSAFYWSVHVDGTSETSFTTTRAITGFAIADDHINVKSLRAATTGRVYAALKTSIDDTSSDQTQPQVILGTYAGGRWSTTTVWTVADCVTRPLVVIDASAGRLHVVATGSASGCPDVGDPGAIFEKTTSLSSPVFAAGRGTVVLRDGDSANVSNATASKQSVDSTSGLVLLATNSETKRYWYSDTRPGPADGVADGGASGATVDVAGLQTR